MNAKPAPSGFPQRKLAEIPAVTPQQMRDIQRLAQETFGLDILEIVENAGRATAVLSLAMLGGKARGQRIVVLAGGGNAGASGLAAVRNLVNWGFDAEFVLGEVEDQMSFAARRQLHILRESGIAEPHDRESSEMTLEEHLRTADLVIDALVGYGLVGPPTGLAAAVTEMAVASRTPILALDIPTGINAQTGEVSSPAVRACTTLVFDLPKQGQLLPACRNEVGEMYLADIGIPRAAHESLGITVRGVYDEGPVVRLRR